MRTTIVLAVASWLAVGCAARGQLEPAPEALPAPPGPGKGAVGVAEGVSMEIRSDAWAGFPRRLTEVTPILVTIENAGTQPLRIRYSDFTLVAASGKRYAAIPPFHIDETEVEPIRPADFAGFYVAPYHSRYFPRLRPYSGYFPFDPFYYDTYYPRFVRIPLPTGDMVQKALPEGVLEPGGRITGFLYFENVDKDEGRVNFRADLVNVETGERFGTVDIPLVVE